MIIVNTILEEHSSFTTIHYVYTNFLGIKHEDIEHSTIQFKTVVYFIPTASKKGIKNVVTYKVKLSSGAHEKHHVYLPQSGKSCTQWSYKTLLEKNGINVKCDTAMKIGPHNLKNLSPCKLLPRKLKM